MSDIQIADKKEPRFHGEVSEKSHRNMSHIKGKDTSIEIVLRKALWARGYRFRKGYKELPGRPDIVLTKYKIAIFCDSEFFHGKDWEYLKVKLQAGKNPEYWTKKIERNIERDRKNEQALKVLGWTFVRFWGNEIKKDIIGCVKVIDEMVFDFKFSDNKTRDTI